MKYCDPFPFSSPFTDKLITGLVGLVAFFDSFLCCRFVLFFLVLFLVPNVAYAPGLSNRDYPFSLPFIEFILKE